MSPDIHTLSGAYVLDAIDDDERSLFEGHLARCESCREEVDALRHATAALAENSAVAPPAHLRTRVLAAVERTQQLPPLTPRVVPAVRPRWAPRLLAAAAAVVALVGIGVTAREMSDGPVAITASDVFGSSDARVKSIALDGGQVRIGISKRLGRIAVDGADMPPLPRDRVYQLWLVTDAGAQSLDVMDDSTDAVELIPAEGELAVTAEPTGGSDQPTSEPIVTVDPSDL